MKTHLNETIVNGNVSARSIYTTGNIIGNNSNSGGIYSYQSYIYSGDYLAPGVYVMWCETTQSSNNQVSYRQSLGIVPWINGMQSNVGCGNRTVYCDNYIAKLYNVYSSSTTLVTDRNERIYYKQIY